MERRQSEEEPTTMARSVTPTELTPPAKPPLDDDLKAILEPFFVELGSFKGDNIGLRKAIQAFGCSLQLQDNTLLAQTKKADEALTGKAVDTNASLIGIAALLKRVASKPL